MNKANFREKRFNLMKLDTWTYKEASNLGFRLLSYKGKNIGLRDYVPTSEIWFVTKRNHIVKKVTDKQFIKLNFIDRLMINLKTSWLELRGY